MTPKGKGSGKDSTLRSWIDFLENMYFVAGLPAFLVGGLALKDHSLSTALFSAILLFLSLVVMNFALEPIIWKTATLGHLAATETHFLLLLGFIFNLFFLLLAPFFALLALFFYVQARKTVKQKEDEGT